MHDDVHPAHEGENRLLLVRIEREAERFDVAQETLEHGVGAGTLRRQAREERRSFGHGVSYHASEALLLRRAVLNGRQAKGLREPAPRM